MRIAPVLAFALTIFAQDTPDLEQLQKSARAAYLKADYAKARHDPGNVGLPYGRRRDVGVPPGHVTFDSLRHAAAVQRRRISRLHSPLATSFSV